MLRSTRFTQPRSAIDRAPIMFTAAAIIILTAAFACAVKSDKQEKDALVSTQPTVVTTPDTAAGEVQPLIVVPENVSFATAESTYNQRRYQEATAMFEVYVQRRADNPYGHYMLGLSAWKSGELALARSAFERSREIDPTRVKTLLNLSRVLLEQNEPKLALERVTEAMALDPSSAEVYRLEGRVHTTLGEPHDAIESYQVALSLDSTDVWSMNNMGLVLINEGRYSEALPALARAVQLRPGSPVFQNNLGIALERTGHFVAAADAYRAAISADPSYAKASVSLARVSGLVEDSTTSPVELTTLANSFQDEVRSWKESRSRAVITAVKPDSGRRLER